MTRRGANEIALTLRSRIDSGEWLDSRMPPERDLAEDFGVARNTIRRAMALLKQDGAISRHVGRGTYITPENDAFGAVVARIRNSSPTEMMEARLVLEPHAAAAAATGASALQLDAVVEAHERACAATDLPTFETWDAEFHHRIFACSRNDLLKEMHNLLRVLRNQTAWFEMKKRSFSEARRQLYCQEHGALVEALRQRDSEGAERAMRAHLNSVRLNMLGR
jgi:DNA-binding FadR family transcriptional regulator